MLKGAIVGVGNVAFHGHLPVWSARPEVEIVAAADERPAARPEFARRFPQARWHHSVEALLDAHKLDFVDICTPPAFHSSAILQALERGAHVLCEKPLVLSSAELAQLVAIARKGNRVVATVHNWRHAPVLLRATDLVRTGSIGALSRVRWETLRDQPAAVAASAGNWRIDPAIAGGGILIDHGWHALYVIQQWLSGEPERVSAKLEKRRYSEWPIEDTAEVVLEYPRPACHSEERSDEESAPAAAEFRSRSLAEPAPNRTGDSKRGSRSLASVGMTERREALGMTERGEGLGMTKRAARAEIFLTWTAAERANRVTLEGSAGTIAIDGGRLEIRSAAGAPTGREELPGSLSEGSHHPDWFGGVVTEFLEEIRDPGRRGASLAEADRCLRWIATAYESGHRGGEALEVIESRAASASLGVAS